MVKQKQNKLEYLPVYLIRADFTNIFYNLKLIEKGLTASEAVARNEGTGPGWSPENTE